MTMALIETATVGSGGAGFIEFTGIPSGFKHLVMRVSLRSDTSTDGGRGTFTYYKIQVNGSNQSSPHMYLSNGGGVYQLGNDDNWQGAISIATNTANTFNTANHYFGDYATAGNHAHLGDYASENNASGAGMGVTTSGFAGAITSLKIIAATGNLVEFSSASLYGILPGSDGITTVA